MQHVGLNTSQIKCGRVFARIQSYLPEVARRGGVTGSLAPGHQQSLTIVGPMEVVDYAGVELCQLSRFGSADRLIQYVESAVPREAVLQENNNQLAGDQHLRNELLVCTSFEVRAGMNGAFPRPPCRVNSAFNRSV